MVSMGLDVENVGFEVIWSVSEGLLCSLSKVGIRAIGF